MYFFPGIIVAITDFMAERMGVNKKFREYFSLISCLLSFVFGLCMVTKGGLYMFTLWDYYSATGLALFWFCFWECVALSWGYGADNLYDHMEDMLGRKINGWLKICCKYISPFIIMVRNIYLYQDKLVYFWSNFQALFLYCAFTYEKLKLIDYEYPLWAHIVGMCMGIVSTAFVPLYFLYSLIISPGNKVSEVAHFQKYSKWKTHY